MSHPNLAATPSINPPPTLPLLTQQPCECSTPLAQRRYLQHPPADTCRPCIARSALHLCNFYVQAFRGEYYYLPFDPPSTYIHPHHPHLTQPGGQTVTNPPWGPRPPLSQGAALAQLVLTLTMSNNTALIQQLLASAEQHTVLQAFDILHTAGEALINTITQGPNRPPAGATSTPPPSTPLQTLRTKVGPSPKVHLYQAENGTFVVVAPDPPLEDLKQRLRGTKDPDWRNIRFVRASDLDQPAGAPTDAPKGANP